VGSWLGIGERLRLGHESAGWMHAFGLSEPVFRCGDMSIQYRRLVAGKARLNETEFQQLVGTVIAYCEIE
jgi:hypothetical protein